MIVGIIIGGVGGIVLGVAAMLFGLKLLTRKFFG